VSLDDLRWLMGINFWGVVHGVKYFLPLLKKEPQGAHREYFQRLWDCRAGGTKRLFREQVCGRGFTEALRHELEGTSVFVSCVHPGRIRTPIARRARLGANAPPSSRDEAVARFDRLTSTMPDAAAARILQGVERREPRILIGRDARQIDISQRLRPGTYWKTLARSVQEPAR
jgi:NAD(P)-dependent dehydrogenase (short-subunit alcohol dehydrogenase family)